MSNITLRVDEKVLTAVRRHAAERESSVNALVREFLTEIAHRADRARKARVRIGLLSRRSRGRIGKATWTRDDLHAR